MKTGKSLAIEASSCSSSSNSKESTLLRLQKLQMERNEYCVGLSVSRPEDLSKKRIAILVVIVESLPHEDIWRSWMSQGDDSKCEYQAELFIHAKHPEKLRSAWARERLIRSSLKPEWNSPEVVRAMLALLSESLKDTQCGRFIFATESCIPIQRLDIAGGMLFNEDKSWLNAFHQPKNRFEEAECFRAVRSDMIPFTSVWKSIPGKTSANA